VATQARFIGSTEMSAVVLIEQLEEAKSVS